MKISAKRLTMLAAIIGFCTGAEALASGDNKAYKNPNGAPDETVFSSLRQRR